MQRTAKKLALKGEGKLYAELEKALSDYLMKKMPKEIQEARKQANAMALGLLANRNLSGNGTLRTHWRMG